MNIQKFDMALACAYGADEWAEGTYYMDLLIKYRSLSREDMKKSRASELMTEFIENLSSEQLEKFMRNVYIIK